MMRDPLGTPPLYPAHVPTIHACPSVTAPVPMPSHQYPVDHTPATTPLRTPCACLGTQLVRSRPSATTLASPTACHSTRRHLEDATLAANNQRRPIDTETFALPDPCPRCTRTTCCSREAFFCAARFGCHDQAKPSDRVFVMAFPSEGRLVWNLPETGGGERLAMSLVSIVIAFSNS